MIDDYDILTIYDFYDELGIKINSVLNYCIKNIEDNFLIEELSCISKNYKELVMKRMTDEMRYTIEGFPQDIDDVIGLN